VGTVVHPAWESEVVECAAATLKPSQDARAGRFKKLELDGATCLSLDDGGPGADPPATDEVANSDLHDVTAAQLAVDREVEHRSISDPLLLVQPEADGPDLLRFEGALCAELSTCVPRLPVPEPRIVFGMSHSLSPAGQTRLGKKDAVAVTP
jgi:hypothetical protein